jgi:hypothetical protein
MSATAEQITLDDYRTQLGRAAASTGLRNAAIGDPDLFSEACDAIAQRARLGYTFSADEIRSDLGGVSGSAVGSAFRSMAAQGVIFCVGLETSKSASRHAGLVRRWAGVGSG